MLMFPSSQNNIIAQYHHHCIFINYRGHHQYQQQSITNGQLGHTHINIGHWHMSVRIIGCHCYYWMVIHITGVNNITLANKFGANK